MKDRAKREDVLEANIKFHSALANSYNTEQPHFRQENKTSVSKHLARLAGLAGSELLIDFGCGTGFIIDLAVPYYNLVIGVDVTPAMLARIDLSLGKVKVLQADTGSIPLKDKIANVITANTFLHHLYDVRPTVAEAWRLLKDGGVFYSEEDPNIYFWQSMKGLDAANKAEMPYSKIVDRELNAVLNSHENIEETKGIDARVVQMAEYQKMILGGMCTEEIRSIFYQTGFSTVNIEYYWFLGQGEIMHRCLDTSEKIDAYLHSILPLSRQLFKYFKIEAWK